MENKRCYSYSLNKFAGILISVFLIGLFLVIKGKQIEKYLNQEHEPINNYQTIGWLFLIIVVITYLVMRLFYFSRKNRKPSVIMIILMIVSALFLADPLILKNASLFSILSIYGRGFIVSFILWGFVMLIIILTEHIVDSLNRYFMKSEDIDSKATVFISSLALLISFLSMFV